MACPSDVVLVRGDTGDRIPCELFHIGEVDGCDTWEIAGITYRIGLDRIEIGVLPAHTAVQFATDCEMVLPGND